MNFNSILINLFEITNNDKIIFMLNNINFNQYIYNKDYDNIKDNDYIKDNNKWLHIFLAWSTYSFTIISNSFKCIFNNLG